jgi:LemA protein
MIRWTTLLMTLLLVSGCGYNALQMKEEGVFKAWGDIESSLQRRADLIPNLVETVKGYARHERETLEGVINARARATSVQISPKDLSDPAAMQQFQEAQGGLSSALARLMVVVEQYPDLKATRTSSICSTSWKARKTASMWPASATTRQSRNSTRPSASSRKT